MMVFIMVIHALVCVMLACIILMQSGRGGGLTESFASAESIFGAQTNTLLVKTTTVLASVFLVTCLSLAVMHSLKGKSLMSDQVAVPVSSKVKFPSDQTATQTSEAVNQAVQSASQEASSQTQKVEDKLKSSTAEINQNAQQVEPVLPTSESVPTSSTPQPVPAK